MKYFLFFVYVVFTIDMADAEYPEKIPAYINWDFEAEAPKDYLDFISFARKIQSETTNDLPWYSPIRLYLKFIQTNLDKSVNYKTIKVSYEYSVQGKSGEWSESENIVEVSSESEVTYGEILYSLHHNTNSRLHNQDIMAIEGFELKEGTSDDLVPTYIVWLGS